ncbi:MAG: indole-3-glycerol phosphate synthase TrpC [Elusimicrobia bacterium]|nr:indole-3-glycerol phosphate synthase TrpC [Elusimicrobiota bacterium]
MNVPSVNNVLQQIVEQRRARLRQAMERQPLAMLERQVAAVPPPKDFKTAIHKTSGIQVIAEFKRASPSAGALRPGANPVQVAEAFLAGGAAAVSILTEEDFFHGSLEDLQSVRRQSPLPLLRKDFMVDPYQVYEARAWGADAVLLITSILSPTQLAELFQTAQGLGVTPLVEVHTAAELERALGLGAPVIGLNNRNLQDFSIDLTITTSLIGRVPREKVVVAESGFETPEQIQQLDASRITAVLVGEHLMRARDISTTLHALVQAGQRAHSSKGTSW